jgi:2'-5' RNA ligase
VPKSTRTFIALPVPEPVGRKLAGLQEKLARQIPGVRWVDPAGFHVTLNFLGNVVDTDLHLVCQAVAGVVNAAEVFETSLEGVGAFPNPSRPRVIWAGINAGGEPLTELHHELATALAAFGYRSDEPRFHSHVTIGRIKNDGKSPTDLTSLVESNRTWPGGSFQARELIVYASNPGSDGPVYTPLGRARLRVACQRHVRE